MATGAASVQGGVHKEIRVKGGKGAPVDATPGSDDTESGVVGNRNGAEHGKGSGHGKEAETRHDKGSGKQGGGNGGGKRKGSGRYDEAASEPAQRAANSSPMYVVAASSPTTQVATHVVAGLRPEPATESLATESPPPLMQSSPPPPVLSSLTPALSQPVEAESPEAVMTASVRSQASDDSKVLLKGRGRRAASSTQHTAHSKQHARNTQ